MRKTFVQAAAYKVKIRVASHIVRDKLSSSELACMFRPCNDDSDTDRTDTHPRLVDFSIRPY